MRDFALTVLVRLISLKCKKTKRKILMADIESIPALKDEEVLRKKKKGIVDFHLFLMFRSYLESQHHLFQMRQLQLPQCFIQLQHCLFLIMFSPSYNKFTLDGIVDVKFILTN